MCRWKSIVVVTNPFHQFRSYWTFRCAVQTLPPDRRMKVMARFEASENHQSPYDRSSVPAHCLDHLACVIGAGQHLLVLMYNTNTALWQVQVWLARLPGENVRLRGLALQRVYSAWDFYREIAAILWYFMHGWLCRSSCCPAQ